MELDILKRFGLNEDPFADPEPFESQDLQTLRAEIRRCAEGRGWLCVTGVKGAGKTFATYDGFFHADCRLVRTLGGDRFRYRGSQIDGALFEDLTEERPRAGREARRRQLERILGEASKDKPVVVLIDEATVMPHQTFTEIKFLRDSLRYGADPRNPRRPDRRPLFGVVMLGWPSLSARIESDNELRPRVRRYKMQGLSRAEVHGFIEHVGLTKVCPKEVRNILADFVRYPLHILSRIHEGMERAYYRGAKQLSVEDVSRDISELYRMAKQHNLTLKDIATETGLSVSCVHAAVNNGLASDKTKEKIQAFLQEKEAQLRGESDAATAKKAAG